jgi:hypothetical protein
MSSIFVLLHMLKYLFVPLTDWFMLPEQVLPEQESDANFLILA